MEDYYKTLNIDKKATSLEIKKAYRKLALQYHPDKNKSDNAHNLFIKIHIAYEILVDPIKREEYDEILTRKNQNETKTYKKETTHKKDFTEQYWNKNAERYANMSYNEFEKVIDQIVSFGKATKRTAKMGCGWLLAILFFPLGIIGIFRQLFVVEEIQGGIIFLSLFLIFLGFGGYAMATEKN